MTTPFLKCIFSVFMAMAPLAIADTFVQDKIGLNRVPVQRVLRPTRVEEIQQAIRESTGPVSIGGARYSQGGQVAARDSLFIDMSAMKKIVVLAPADRVAIVQAGATWRDLLEAIDPHNLSPKIMQSYSNFSIGGSLSVNAHGRYAEEGALIKSVRSLRIVVASGDLLEASRSLNSDLFYAAVGGYGGVGVIVDATLDLAENSKLERQVLKISTQKYREYFGAGLPKGTVLHNADLSLLNYETLTISNFVRTDLPLSDSERLRPTNQGGWMNKLASRWMSGAWLDLALREYVVDPLRLGTRRVVWRNAEASQDISRLGLTQSDRFAYLLQEYFIPVEGFDAFLRSLKNILQKHDVQIANVAVRHALADTESVLSWCPQECFAFVLYYKQDKSTLDRSALWTRQLIDAALQLSGTYYLPYQLHATPEQFKRAYPNMSAFLATKKKYDPEGRFINKLWDKYLAG